MRKSEFLLAGAATLIAQATAVAAPAPLLSYNFNEGTGTAATNAGTTTGRTGAGVSIPADAQLLNLGTGAATDLHGANGSGLSGAAGDYGLNLSQPAGQGSNGNSPFAARVTRPQIQGLSSFTLSGFFKADEAIDANARLFSFSDGNNAVAFQLSAIGNGQLGFNVNAGGTSTAAGAYSDAGKYVYFAVTYDGTKTVNNVVFYKGTTGPGGAFSTVTTQTVNAGAVAALAGDPYFFYIGNNASAIRQFDGYLDNVRLYGSATDATGALSAADVQAVYASSVPEPASLSLLAGGAALLVRRRRAGR